MNFNSLVKIEYEEDLNDMKQPQLEQNVRSLGTWTEKEKNKYYLFVWHHRNKFTSKSRRKSLRVFKKMAQYIETRNPSQCRTFHQKNLSGYNSVEECMLQHIHFNSNFIPMYEKQQTKLQFLEDIDFIDMKKQNKPEQPQFEEKKDKQLFPTMPSYQEAPTQEEQWKECHILYLQWINKLSQLIKRSYI